MTVARDDAEPRVAGLVLAAGAGVRSGGPKALRSDDAGRAWVEIAASSLRDSGCRPVVVVVGASATEALALVPDWASPVVCDGWAEGQSASLRAGLDAVEARSSSERADAVLVTLVDLPWQGVAEAFAVLRLLDREAPRASLARLVTTDGTPGHPVLIGRDHWEPLRATLSGDEGARGYLAAAEVRTVRL